MKEVESSTRKTAKGKTLVLEAIAIVFWIFVMVKLFIYDIDIYIVQRYYPKGQWILDYKFFVLLAVISFYWLLARRAFVMAALLLVFYPFVWTFWRIPKFLFRSRSWVLVFSVSGFILSFFKTLKVNFVAFTFAAISCLLIIIANEHSLLRPR